MAGCCVVMAAAPSAATDRDEYLAICTEFIEQHFDEAEWRQACFSAVKQYIAAHPAPTRTSTRFARPQVPSNQIQPLRELVVDHREQIASKLRSGTSLDVLVEFEVRDVDQEAFERAFDEGRPKLAVEDLAFKRAEYARVKEHALQGLEGVEVIRDFENLAKSFMRVPDESALESLLACPEVRAVYENRGYDMALAQSLPLIEQPQAAAAGADGTGTAIAVLDTGVDYTVSPFNCTAPGLPAGCRVAAIFEAATDDSQLDANGHGTNVAAIAAGTAGSADLIVSDVFTGSTAFWVDVIDAVNWVISNQATFNIVAMNVSIYDGSVRFVSDCPGHALASDFANALAAGVQPIVSAGNDAHESGVFVDGISPPACVPAAISVGAVYDANVGDFSWTFSGPDHDCTNATTNEDQLTCFSQSSPNLSLLAPGTWIHAGGLTFAGTSQAAPHVAGAWSSISSLGIENVEAALMYGGDPIVDSRPVGGRTTNRINLVPEPGQAGQFLVGVVGILALLRRRHARE